VLDPAGITYVGIGLLFHDRNPRLLDQTLEPLDPTLEARDYEGVPWGDEDEDIGVGEGRRRGRWSSVGDGGEVVPIPSLQRLFDRS
jgi:hypothetical protein